MATLTIRSLDDELKSALRRRAAAHGRSMEAEVRAILAAVLRDGGDDGALGTRIHQSFAAIGGVDLPLPPRTELARAASLTP